jgi:L-alanine-DL-glutamate epimerase-like enolase superfamily enzyme
MNAHNSLRIKNVERIMVRVPFTPRCEEWNALLVWRWQILSLIKVTTDDPEITGWGEVCWHYNSGSASEVTMARVVGQNPLGLLHDDSLGLDLQMALYDLVGKAQGLPVNQLLPLPSVREWCPLGWWNTKMPPEALGEEAREAYGKGYRFHKFKARPWIDVFAQVKAMTEATPDDYRLDMDWNDMLLTVGNATPILQELDTHPRVAIYEGPLPQRDVEGYRLLRQKLAKPIAMHFGLPAFPTVIQNDMCDGFVVFGGVQEVIRQGILAAAFEKNFWIQQVGAGLTTAMVAHLGSVLTHARWPAITCMNNYSHSLLTEPLTIRHGDIQVPTGPGLGVTIDENLIEKFRMEPPYDLPERRHILTVAWPGGREVHYAHMQKPAAVEKSVYGHLVYAEGAPVSSGRQCWEDFLAGNQPIEPCGVEMRVWKDDGSAAWQRLYEKAKNGPVLG